MQVASEIIGEIIAQRWQIQEYLGEGNMSYVYKAQDIETGKVIILKLIKRQLVNNPTDLENLAKQAENYIALNHENIASYYDMRLSDKGLFLFCDYLSGESLSSLLSKAGKLPLEQCLKLCRQIIAGLEYAHERNIVHGDLRPGNIYIVNDQFNIDEAKITDFGFMRLIESITKNNEHTASSTHPILGDAPYMSPEQRLGQDIDKRSDLYSLGCLMYEIACGKSPFISKSAMETTYRQKHKGPTELEKLLPTHPLLVRYQLIANKLLRANVKERYQSTLMVRQDLDLAVSANEQEWQKKANVLKASNISEFSAHKCPLIAVTASLAILIFLIPLIAIIEPYFSPWIDKSFDDNKLWLFQNKFTEKQSTRQIAERNFLINKLNTIIQTQGRTSRAYMRVLFSFAQFLLTCGQFNEALTKFAEIESKQTVGESVDPAALYANIALAQYAVGNLNSAEKYAQQALNLSQNTSQIESEFTALKVLGDIYNEKNDINQAEHMYTLMQSLANANRLNNAAAYAYANALLADIWRRENKLKESEQLYKEAIDWGGNYIGHQGLFMAKAYYGLGLLYYQQGNLKAADYQLKQALPIAEARLGTNNGLVMAIKSLQDYILFHKNIFAWCKVKFENKGHPESLRIRRT